MEDEIKDILDRLERIDHKEYIAFEFADSADFDEMARCFEERKKMADYITNLQQENERLKEIVENLTTMTASEDGMQIKITAQYKLEKAQLRIDKAIEKLKYYSGGEADYYVPIDYIIKILKGENNE